MMRRPRVLILLAAFCLITPAVAPAEEEFRFPEARHGQGELKYVNGVPVMFLEGTPQQIGEQLGTLLSQPLGPILEFPKRFVDQSGSIFAWPIVVRMSQVLMKHAPEDYRVELDNAISASGHDKNTLYVANTLLELRRIGGCSTLIVEGDRSETGHPIFGRNMDFPTLGILQEYSLIAVVKPKGKFAFVSIGFPGINGVISGMNEHGLSIATLDVFSSGDQSARFDPKGVPMAYTFRRILEECRTVAEAEKILKESPRTRYMNLAVCDKESGAVFELTPKTVAVRRAVDGLLTCTNHFRSDELCTSKRCHRFTALEQSRGMKKLATDDVVFLLNEANQGPMTIQSMLFEPAESRFHVAIGDGPVTDPSRFVQFNMKKLLSRTVTAKTTKSETPAETAPVR